MNRYYTVIALAAALLLPVAGLRAEESTSKMMADATAKSNCLAFLTCNYEVAPEIGARPLAGQAICISDSGIFLTQAIDPMTKAERIKDLKLSTTGNEPKSYKAEFLWGDQETGLTFVRVTEKGGNWLPVKFDSNAKLPVGAKLVSLGLFEGAPSRNPAASVAYVAAVLRVPNRLAFVTGGNFGAPCSPVMNESGAFVGIVTPSPALPSTINIANQGSTEAFIRPRSESSFFRPAADFQHALDYMAKNPDKPRQLPWIGVLSFQGLLKDNPLMAGVNVPGVQVIDLVPGSNGDNAGLKSGDIIIGLNGKSLERLAEPDLVSTNLQRMIAQMPVGTKIALTVRRGKEEKNLNITLQGWPPRPIDAPQFFSFPLGMVVREKVKLDKAFKTPTGDTPGLLVLEVFRGGPADKAQLKSNDLITTVNGQEVTDVASFKKVLAGIKPDRVVNLVVTRGDQTQTISIQPPAAAR